METDEFIPSKIDFTSFLLLEDQIVQNLVSEDVNMVIHQLAKGYKLTEDHSLEKPISLFYNQTNSRSKGSKFWEYVKMGNAELQRQLSIHTTTLEYKWVLTPRHTAEPKTFSLTVLGYLY